MPQRKQKKGASKRSRRGARSLVPKPILPPRQTVTMSYSFTASYTEAAAGAGVFRTFKLNDLFDPDFTGVGTQPVGYDQISNIYSRFRVLKVGIRVLVMGLSSNAYVGVYPSAQSTLPASFQAYADQPRGMSALVQSGGPTRTFTMTANLWDIFAVTKSEYLNDQDFGHLSTSSPARPCYMQIWLQGLNAVIGSAVFETRFTYLVEVSSPFALNVS